MDDTKFAFRIVLVEFRDSDLKPFSLYDKQESCMGKKDLIQTKIKMEKEVALLIETKVREKI